MKTFAWENLPFRSSVMKLYKHHLVTGDEVESHHHDFYEIFWILSGQGEHWVNGENRHLSRGDLVWIRPYDTHRLVGRSIKPLIFYNLAFPAYVIDELAERYPECRGFFETGDRRPLVMTLMPFLLDWLESATTGLLRNPDSRFELDRFLLNLLGELASYRANLFRSCPLWLREAVMKLTREPELLKQGSGVLATLSKRSIEHTARELKRHTGMTPSEAVNRIRLDYASRLLANTELSVTEVVYKSGFHNPSCFYERFRKLYGSSPRNYRREHLASSLQGDDPLNS